MSALAGVCYADSRPVDDRCLQTLSVIHTDTAPHGRRLHAEPGVAMLSFALHFDALSEQERQPVAVSPATLLTWDGRLDNRVDLQVRLQPDVTGDDSDATLMALAYRKWGDGAFEGAIGDWSVAVWNRETREIVLARDYAGNRPLYFCSTREYVAWSTALEPLARFCQKIHEIDETYLAGWLTLDPPESYTLFRDIFLVPAGHLVRLRPGHQPTRRRFTAPTALTLRYRSPDQYHDHYRALFTDAVRVRLRSKHTVWTELSGGYDSSSITCVANALVRTRAVSAPALQPVSVITPASPEADESPYITAVERACGLTSRRLPLQGGFTLSPSGAYSDVTSDTARRMRPYEAAAEAGAHVLLSGELGDVITLGISAHDALWDQLRAGEVRTFVRDSFDHCRLSRTQLWPLWVRMAAAASPLFINQADRTRHVRALATARGIPLATRSIPRSAMAKIFGIRADFLARVPTPDVPTPYDVRQFPRSHRSMLRGLHSFIAHNYVLGARGGLAVGTTFPFSHKPLVDFVLSVPCDVLWRPDHPRAFVAAALRDVLPPLIVERRTKGSALSAVSRFLIPTVLKDLDRVAEWQLVSRGYASPRELSDLLGALLTGSQSVPAIVIRLLSTEGLLRSLDTGRFTAAMAQAM